MSKLDTSILEQISAGLIEVSQYHRRLHPPYPLNLQRGYDRVVLAFLLGGKPQQAPDSVPTFYEDWCEKSLEEWELQIDSSEIDASDALLCLGEPTELAIELASIFGGSVMSQEQSRIAQALLQHCQSHPQGEQIYVKFRRFIIEHPILTNQELMEAKSDFGLGIGLSDLLEECYEPAPSCYELEGNFYACPYCHALASINYKTQQAIANPNCNRCEPGRRFARKIKLSSEIFKLKRGIERFWFYPGRAEIRLYHKFTELGLKVELYPECDRYDLRVTFSDKEIWALDLKDYANPYRLIKHLSKNEELLPSHPSWSFGYIVVPTERKKNRPAYLKELKSRWRWQNVKPIFDEAIFRLVKQKVGLQDTKNRKRKDERN